MITQQVGSKVTGVVYAMYIVGGLMALSSAIRLGFEIWNYYHPDYSDIPTAMVDLIDTKDGDRYIKYDVVYETNAQSNGELVASIGGTVASREIAKIKKSKKENS